MVAEQLRRLDPDKHESLTHARLLSATVDGQALHKPKWNSLLHHLHIIGHQRLGSFDTLKNASGARIKEGYMNTMNTELAHRYGVDFEAFKSFIADYSGVSEPHLIQVLSAYQATPVKLMIVGQQTKGWGNSEQPCTTVADILRLYDRFALGRHYRTTPFWIAARQIYQALNPQHDVDGFLWSNLVKVDQAEAGTDRPLPMIEERVCECHWLSVELEITKPDAELALAGSGRSISWCARSVCRKSEPITSSTSDAWY
ncbi:MAG TPA: hypothetical protein VNU46_01005 [Gemmatimonadaceae bacterium]|nr:hypothetical protein [Gemmatimonadaceae bacterium]